MAPLSQIHLLLGMALKFEIAIYVINYCSPERAFKDNKNEGSFVKIGQAAQKL